MKESSNLQESAAMLGQPPLPMLPWDARPIGDAAGVCEDEVGGVVFIWGNAAFAWDAGDDGARRFAAVQLVATKTARPSEVAQAFGVSTTSFWRWQRDFAESGLAGLIEQKKGPKAQRKVSEKLATRVKELRAQGMTLQAIADDVGLSTYPVRQVLGLVAQEKESIVARSGEVGAPDREIPDDVVDAVAPEPTVELSGEPDIGLDDVVDDSVSSDLLALASTTQLVSSALSPVPLPEPRTSERVLARFGFLGEAEPVFTQGAGLPRLGTLLILPALEATGLMDATKQVYRRMHNGFYGLSATILTMVFLAVAREPRAEGATRIAPHDLGRLLGLDRAPEVKTIRRKLAELAGRKVGSTLIAALAARHAKTDPEVMGYLYLDGHVRVYSGRRDLQKAHVTRARIAAPATLETWACDQRGDPVFVVTSVMSASLVTEIRRLLPELKSLAGGHNMTVVFDRGGWSPDLFAQMVAAGIDFLTYRKGKTKKEPAGSFSEQTFVEDGVEHSYDLAERGIRLKLSKKVNGAKTIRCRQVTRRRAGGRQTQIVTSRTDVPAPQIAHRMFARWRQENYFRYGRQHFALDALDSYASVSDDPERSVPNPARKVAQARLRKARTALAHAEAALGVAASLNVESKRPTMRGFKIANAELTKTADEARSEVTRLEDEMRATPTRLALKDVRPEATVLDEECKLVTHAIRMSTYNAESALARMLTPHFRVDEARALLREAFNSPGDLEVVNGALEVRIDPLSAPRRTRALAALCTELTTAETRYPGTDLVLRYSVKDRPGIS
jgi:transposase-like protein